ncbi:MAG: hypothetical protein M3355_01085 [Actinomycetota bacterium]|nr:hypothetical protein [Actinomycetota bacterium]
MTGDDVADNSLTGNDMAAGSVTGFHVGDNALGGADIDEATLGQVPSALIGGFGRDSTEGTCNPDSTTFVACASVSITVPASGARALLVGRIRATGSGAGFCRLGTSTVGAVPASTVPAFSSDSPFIPLNGITPPLPAGSSSFGIDCTENAGDIDYDEAKISVVLISPN